MILQGKEIISKEILAHILNYTMKKENEEVHSEINVA